MTDRRQKAATDNSGEKHNSFSMCSSTIQGLGRVTAAGQVLEVCWRDGWCKSLVRTVANAVQAIPRGSFSAGI